MNVMHRWLGMLCVGVLFAGVLVACGGDHGGGSAGDASSTTPLLAGNGSDRALAALRDVRSTRAAPEDIENGVLLSRISVVLKLDATVTDVNAAAQEVGATGFAFARPNSPFITLAVPRQANGVELDRLAARLRGRSGILVAASGHELSALELPSANGQTALAVELDHLLATHFPAAWNVRGLATTNCGSGIVTVLVPDFYRGIPPPSFNAQVPGASDNFDTPLVGSGAGQHGYGVVAILAGRFDATAPTGANPFPECLKIVPVDIAGTDEFQSLDGLANVVRTAVEAQIGAGKIIVNGSFSYYVCAACTALNLNDYASGLRDHIASRFSGGTLWAEFAMQPGIVDNMLLAVAAGNDLHELLGELYAGFRDAHLATPFAVAAQLSNLSTLAASPALWATSDPGLPALSLDPASIASLQQNFEQLVGDPVTDRNLAIVGSTTKSDLFSELRESSFSEEGADLRAVGEDVLSLDSHIESGTSFSAPQVAGLASYLWLLDADLRSLLVTETLKLIRATSRSNGSVDQVIDAYGAVLALDARHHDTRLRKELLDVNGDGVFDVFDLQIFAQAYGLANTPSTPSSRDYSRCELANTPSTPSSRDYSRCDLNGDGFTGGNTTERFDLDANGLDANGAPIINSVDETIEGYHLTFNEAALSDIQILCYYAYSPLYFLDPDGQNEQARTNILGPDHCVGAQLNVQLPTQISSPATLSTVVQVPTENGQLAPAPNQFVGYTPTCATVSPASGRTDANGATATTVTPIVACTSVSIAVVARADANTTPLAQQVVTATVGRGATVRSLEIITGRTAGAIEGIITDENFDASTASTVTSPIGDVGGFLTKLSNALTGVTELWTLAVDFETAASVVLKFDLPVVNLLSISGSACASTLDVTLGTTFPLRNLSIAGCLSNVVVTVGDIKSMAGIYGNAKLRANNIGRLIVACPSLPCSPVVDDIQATNIVNLTIGGTPSSTISVTGTIGEGLLIDGNENLTLGAPITADNLKGLLLTHNSFLSAPQITAGDVAGRSPDMSVDDFDIISNTGLPLDAITAGNIGGNLSITDNHGFTDAEAQAFAQRRTIGGKVSISHNTIP